MITRMARALLAVALLPIGACRSHSPANATATIRVELPTQLDVTDMPRLLAVEAMRTRGYTVETLALANTAETVLALERGDLDLASVSDVSGWAAIEKGAPIVTLMDDSITPVILAAKTDITRCEDLTGRRVAIPNLAGGKAFMLHRYLETRCPAARPELLVVAGESARLAGILAGELDAAVMDLENLERIDARWRSQWHTLVAFAKEFPGLTALSLFARRETVEKSPVMVKDWMRAVLEARRRLQDPHVLAGELVTRLGMTPELAAKTASEYLEGKYWDVNGRYTSDSLQQNIDFAIAASSLKPGTKASDLADLSLLNAVLDEIGRQ